MRLKKTINSTECLFAKYKQFLNHYFNKKITFVSLIYLYL
jgi:hypothetical protein